MILCSHLSGNTLLLRFTGNHSRFFNTVRQWLFTIDMQPCSECSQRRGSVMMVWGGDNGSIYIGAFKKLSIVSILNCFWMFVFCSS